MKRKGIRRQQFSVWGWMIVLTLAVSGIYSTVHAQVVFDSNVDGFATVNPTGLEGTASLGKIGDILGAKGIAGSFAEKNYNKAVEDGLVDPEAEALVVLTDDELVAKIKITVPHPPIVIAGAVYIKTEKVAVFKSLPTGGKLRAWKRNINKILNDPDLTPDQKRQALDVIKARKPRAYDRLIDDTGFEIREEEVIVVIPGGVILPEWMIEFEFRTPAFSGMGEALTRVVVEDLLPENFPDGFTADALSEAFPNADIYDFGTDNGDPGLPPNTLNFEFVDSFEDRPASYVFDSDIDGFELVTPEPRGGDASLAPIRDILSAPGIAGSFAEHAFQEAVDLGRFDPLTQALVFQTDDQRNAKLKITVPHPPILVPGAILITTRKVAVFKSLPTGGKLRVWKRTINRILNDPTLSPEDQRQILQAIRDRKPSAYDQLVDGTGFEIREEQVVVIIPGGVIFPQWMVEFEFQTPAFVGMGEALDRVVVEHLSPEEFPDTQSILDAFPDADVVNFGTDNGDTTAVARALNGDIAQSSGDIADQFVNITSTDTLEDLTGPQANLTGTFGNLVIKLNSAGVPKLTIKPEVSNLGDATATGPFKVAAYLSSDLTLDPGDRHLGHFSMNKLNAGVTKKKDRSRRIKDTEFETLIGQYVFLAFDPHNVVPESDEDDNIIGRLILRDDAKNPDDFPPSTTPPVDIELVALSLVSVDPIDVQIPGPVDFSVNGDDIVCQAPPEPCVLEFPPGTILMVEAHAPPGFVFDQWLGPDPAICGPNPICPIELLFDGPLTAVFQLDLVPPPSNDMTTLTIDFIGIGHGAVTSNELNINCTPEDQGQAPCMDTFPSGTVFFLDAIPTPGYVFGQWGGVCDHESGDRCGIAGFFFGGPQNVTVQFDMLSGP